LQQQSKLIAEKQKLAEEYEKLVRA